MIPDHGDNHSAGDQSDGGGDDHGDNLNLHQGLSMPNLSSGGPPRSEDLHMALSFYQVDLDRNFIPPSRTWYNLHWNQ